MMKYTATLVLVFVSTGAAEEPAAEFANCSWYRSKKEGAPVYAEAKADAEAIGKLSRGERVCGIGEQSDFVILQWEIQAILRGGVKGPEQRAFVRTVDLWAPRDRSERRGIEASEIVDYQKTGMAPDDPLWFMRPVLDLFFTRDPCADPETIGCRK